MKTNHTPGPWAITNEETAENIFYIGSKSGSTASAYNKAGGEGITNARLIAAAPELLAYLEAIKAVIENDQIEDTVIGLQAKISAIKVCTEQAIQKATQAN